MSVTQAPVLDIADAAPIKRRRFQGAITFCQKQPMGAVGLVLLAIVAAAGFLANLIAPYDPTSNDFAVMTQAPSWTHLFGTDQFGRDIFSRAIFGARTAMIVGLVSAIVGGSFGLVIGVGSAYLPG